MIGNKGYRKYPKFKGAGVIIDQGRIEINSRFDDKGGLKTNTEVSAEQVALKYRELWQVEQACLCYGRQASEISRPS